ncbi:Hypothetical predicted protein [Mytilus galloprovincialis]|uniref:Uncharacterized protein n=1 Tax=Mytilus galloprovincialis TaxID=29158 RepID=A0A8B6E8P8_MYTGA|nr:Hypothetical predicted protein [Mytilus galloprovincialis]
MFILNGRFGKDSIGRMTCKNKSVVDYIICTCNVLENILDFEVQEFCRLFSDVHSPLSLTLSCKNKKHSDLETNNFTPKIGKWKCEKTLDFRDNLDGEMIEKLFFKIQSLHNAKENAQKPEVDEVVFDLCNILLKSAETTFGLTSNKAHRHSKKQWFDLKCLKAKKEFRKSKRLCKKYGSNIFKERLRKKIFCTDDDYSAHDNGRRSIPLRRGGFLTTMTTHEGLARSGWMHAQYL